MAKQTNQLLLKNYLSRPTSSVPFPEVNKAAFCGREQRRGNGFGHGRGRNNYRIHEGYVQKNNMPFHQSGIILEHHKKRENVYIINLPRIMKMLVTDVE